MKSIMSLANHISSNNKRAIPMRQFVTTGCLLVLVVVIATSTAAAEEERLRVENRKTKEGGQDLAETINYLEGVDKYYSQLSRPRFGRSEYKHSSSSLADRLAGYRMATASDSVLPTRWAPSDSMNVVYQTNPNVAPNQNNRYTPSLADLIRRRLDEQNSFY